MTEKEWFKLMEYCKKHQLPPAQHWAWELAKKELGISDEKEE